MSDSSSGSTLAEGNVGAAFGLVIAAGLATAVGASVVFFPSLVKLASRRVLASGLGFSAGVMVYVSFVEIFFKSITAFSDGGMSDLGSYAYATICFFGGVAIMVIIDILLRCFSGKAHHHHHEAADSTDEPNEVDNNPEETAELHKNDDFDADPEVGEKDEIAATPHCVCHVDDPGAELEAWQRRAREEDENRLAVAEHDGGATEDSGSATNGAVPSGTTDSPATNVDDEVILDEDPQATKPASIYRNKNLPVLKDGEKVADSVNVVDGDKDDDVSDVSENQQANANRHENKKLIRMGISTALAIGIHNFPEGLATFVAALSDLRVGAVLAVAIGVHNIPEGLCVAMPIYYATGNRWKAFGWGLLSGISEPIAAVLGYLILANVFTDFTYAVLFGLVSGMMIVISIRELLPTAHRYDDSDGVVTYSFIVGMFIMALSLVLFYV